MAACAVFAGPARAAEETPSARSVRAAEHSRRIDEFLRRHWQRLEVTPAARCDDATFLRRVTLDLAGRIPTPEELTSFLEDQDSAKRERTIGQLIAGPEFALHFGNVLDRWIQQEYQGDEAFVDYLRVSLREGKTWDRIFRELMIGPWDRDDLRPANRYLDKRAKTLDALTADTARVFFGVDISCAKCHDHPLVADWTQEHFFGMASFFNRTTGGKGKVGEKDSGEVTFLGDDGQEKTARVMFLSGRVVGPAAEAEQQQDASQSAAESQPTSRREQLVNVALEDRRFLSRALVNRVWRYLLGYGLVEPVDQMHSANEPAHAELLDWLAESFVATGYDLHLLVESIVLSEAYQLSSRWQAEGDLPPVEAFAVARLRPLDRRSLVLSLLLATGDGGFTSPLGATERRAQRLLGVEGVRRVTRYLELEQRAADFLSAFDPATANFQSSAAEALFVSNAERFQQLVRAADGNLADRLAKLEDSEHVVTTAFRAALSRSPDDTEKQQLVEWFEARKEDRRAACEQLVWALVSSAEFRFNH